MTGNREHDKEKRGSGQGVAVLAVFGLLMLPVYALSVIPMVWLMHNEYLGDRLGNAVMVVYKPLEYLYEHVRPVTVFYDTIFELIGVK